MRKLQTTETRERDGISASGSPRDSKTESEMKDITPAIIIAIDPGASGGIAWLSKDGVDTYDMPATAWGLANLLMGIGGAKNSIVQVWIEDVPMARYKNPSSGMKVNRHAGMCEGVATALGFEIRLVQPQQWQKALKLGVKASHGANWKRHLQQEAQRRTPNTEITQKTADAVLILHYGMQQK